MTPTADIRQQAGSSSGNRLYQMVQVIRKSQPRFRLHLRCITELATLQNSSRLMMPLYFPVLSSFSPAVRGSGGLRQQEPQAACLQPWSLPDPGKPAAASDGDQWPSVLPLCRRGRVPPALLCPCSNSFGLQQSSIGAELGCDTACL